MSSLLEVDSITSGYGALEVIRSITANVDIGEVFTLIGRNGSGKTTLMKTLVGHLQTREGKIRLKGNELQSLAPSQRARLGIGYVPQGRGIFGTLTVEENLRIGSAIGEPTDRESVESGCEEMYKVFPRLKARSRQRAGTLSGGEQQQLAIARVLVGRPSTILLDEPSDGVQPNIIDEIADFINQLKQDKQISILLVEQHLDLVRAVSDRCAVLDNGSIRESIDPAELDQPEVAKQYLAV